jgi:C1A family cysteine protease
MGDNGYFYMPYAYVTESDLASDFWVINAVKD